MVLLALQGNLTHICSRFARDINNHIDLIFVHKMSSTVLYIHQNYGWLSLTQSKIFGSTINFLFIFLEEEF